MTGPSKALLSCLVALLLLGGAGCMNMRYVRKGAVAAPQEPKSEWNHFFFWGLAGDAEVDLTVPCPDGVARVEVYHSFANQFVGALTLGLYSPTTTEVWCAKPQRTVQVPPAPPSLARVAGWGPP